MNLLQPPYKVVLASELNVDDILMTAEYGASTIFSRGENCKKIFKIKLQKR